MTRSDFIESGVPAGGGLRRPINRHQKGTAMTRMKLQLIITAAISLLIGASIGIFAAHLLTRTAPGLEGQWRQYVRL
jgi:hypothetical protein